MKTETVWCLSRKATRYPNTTSLRSPHLLPAEVGLVQVLIPLWLNQ